MEEGLRLSRERAAEKARVEKAALEKKNREKKELEDKKEVCLLTDCAYRQVVLGHVILLQPRAMSYPNVCQIEGWT